MTAAPPPWSLRPAVAADVEPLAELRATVLRADLERLGRYDDHRVRQRLRDSFSPAHTSIIESGGETAGSITLRPAADGRRLLLEHFYLVPGLQGRGLGSAVLKNVLNRTDSRDRTVGLDVLRGSPARRLYERHGFVVESEDPIDIFMVRTPPGRTDRVRRAYGALAHVYIDLFGSQEKVHADDLAFIGRHLGGTAGRVFDLGCGPGHMAGYLRSLGADVTGVDLVPEFIDHARAAHPDIGFRLGSMDDVEAAGGILAWYSLIHRAPGELDDVLAGFRRALTPGGTLVVGFCDGPEVAAFDHKVTTAYFWPVDEFSRRLSRAGFTEIERARRPGDATTRAHAAIAAR